MVSICRTYVLLSFTVLYNASYISIFRNRAWFDIGCSDIHFHSWSLSDKWNTLHYILDLVIFKYQSIFSPFEVCPNQWLIYIVCVKNRAMNICLFDFNLFFTSKSQRQFTTLLPKKNPETYDRFCSFISNEKLQFPKWQKPIYYL